MAYDKVGPTATTVTTENGIMRIVYHSTTVVTVDWHKRTITLDTGGYYTATTKARMNQASNQYDLGYQVYQEHGDWFVWWPAQGEDSSVQFKDGMVLAF